MYLFDARICPCYTMNASPSGQISTNTKRDINFITGRSGDLMSQRGPMRPRKTMIKTTFSPPTDDRFFEDYIPGSVYEFGPMRVEEEEMIEFARRYDPQAYHVDPEAARKSTFGGLIASGWFTAALTMRLLVDHYVSRVAAMGSPTAGEVRWLRPVRSGDELSLRVEILEARRSESKPDRGIVRAFVEVLNQHREVVMTREAVGFVRCRTTA